MSQTLSVGIIGLGVGEQHINGYSSHPSCTISKICDFDENKLIEVSNKYPNLVTTLDPEEILEDPSIDIVSIASYDNHHASQVVKALKHNKNIFVEKPLCLHQTELEDIFKNLVDKPNLFLSSNLILRKTPRFRNLRQKIIDGLLGNLYYTEANYDYGRISKVHNGWRGQIPFYSVMHGGGIHMIDLIMWLNSQRVRSVTAVATNIASRETSFDFPDCISANLKLDNSSIASVTANFPSVVPHGHRLSVFGDKGTFHHGPLGCAYFWSRDPQSNPQNVTDSYPGTRKGDLLFEFIDKILNPWKQITIDTQEVLDAMSVSIAIEKSLSSASPQDVEYYTL